jgi:uncharacterized membrane protein YidH (DUF202 family)
MMPGFQPADAGLEGFRITRENPRAFLAWVGASFVVSVLAPVITAFMPASVKHGLETITANETPTASQLLDALIVVAPVLVLGLAIQCVMAAAVYRLIFRHDDTRFGYLRLGADELRLMGLTVIYIGLITGLLVGVTMASAVVTAVASVAGTMVAGFVGAVTSLFSIGLVIFVLVRLSLAPVATFAERRLAIFESWGLTRGVFWPLLGAYVLALACIVVIGFLIIVVFSGVAGAVILAGGGELSDVGAMLNPRDSSLKSYFSVGLIAYMVVSSVFSALYNAVIAAPGAVVYQQLHGTPPSRPLTAQAEAG